MELSDIQGFECDAEIRILITGISRKKAIAKLELDTLQKDLVILERLIDNVMQYSLSDKSTLKKVMDKYDTVNLQIETLSSARYINNRLQKQKEKILPILQNIESLMYRASKLNVSLPSLSFSIVADLDKYDLYR